MKKKVFFMLLITLILLFSSYQVFAKTFNNADAVKQAKDSVSAPRANLLKMMKKYPMYLINGKIIQINPTIILGSASNSSVSSNTLGKLLKGYIEVVNPDKSRIKYSTNYSDGSHYFIKQQTVNGYLVNFYGPIPKPLSAAYDSYKKVFSQVKKLTGMQFQTYPNATIYEGMFSKSGYRGGAGTLFDSNNKVKFTGTWKNDSYYEGEIYGVLYTEPNDMSASDPGIYSGHWYMDSPQGIGTLYNADGSVKYKGYWSDGVPAPNTQAAKDATKPVKTGVSTLDFGEDSKYIGTGTGKLTGSTTKSSSFIVNGTGIYISKYGMFREEGTFKNGKLNGQGIRSNALNEAILYKGNFKNGEYDGKGILYDSDDNGKNSRKQYEGNFKAGFFNGQGIYYNDDGTVYFSGNYIDGRVAPLDEHFNIKISDPNIVTVKYNDGTFIGIVKNGVPNGIGWLYNHRNELMELGIYNGGKLNGYGIRYNPKIVKADEGNFVNGILNGQGIEYNRDFGTKCYEGSFVNGMKNGQGIGYEIRSGVKNYEGNFKDNEYDGHGIEYDVSNNYKVYEGNFKNSLYDGAGTYYNDDGSVKFSGTWSYGTHD